jgi:hypothetical protein
MKLTNEDKSKVNFLVRSYLNAFEDVPSLNTIELVYKYFTKELQTEVDKLKEVLK